MTSPDSVITPDAQQRATPRVPFAPDFLTENLNDLEEVRLIGSRCRDCGIALLARRRRCENCTSKNLRYEVLEPDGVVYSFTVQRYRPPGPVAAPDPWVPRPIAWIDLDGEGPRIIAVVHCLPHEIEIGTRVRLACSKGWEDEEGRDVIAYAFRPVAADAAG